LKRRMLDTLDSRKSLQPSAMLEYGRAFIVETGGLNRLPRVCMADIGRTPYRACVEYRIRRPPCMNCSGAHGRSTLSASRIADNIHCSAYLLALQKQTVTSRHSCPHVCSRMHAFLLALADVWRESERKARGRRAPFCLHGVNDIGAASDCRPAMCRWHDISFSADDHAWVVALSIPGSSPAAECLARAAEAQHKR
jgi:hypothetical protein